MMMAACCGVVVWWWWWWWWWLLVVVGGGGGGGGGHYGGGGGCMFMCGDESKTRERPQRKKNAQPSINIIQPSISIPTNLIEHGVVIAAPRRIDHQYQPADHHVSKRPSLIKPGNVNQPTVQYLIEQGVVIAAAVVGHAAGAAVGGGAGAAGHEGQGLGQDGVDAAFLGGGGGLGLVDFFWGGGQPPRIDLYI